MGEKSRSKGFCGWFLVLIVLAVVVAAIVITVKKRSDNHSGSGKPEPVPGPPGAIDKKYSDALKVAMKFFDAQKSGKLVNNEISWRGDSGLKDGSEAKLDLSKGMYDAGDHMKFGFPMAFTATVLSWAILEYGDQMDAVNELEPAQDSLKWITDYLINAHPSENVLYIQDLSQHHCFFNAGGGLIWVSEWNCLQHPVASAFLAALYSDYMLTSQTASISCDGETYKPSDLRKFARSQADYVLGKNPMKMSFLVGYGDNYPQFVHHRGASIPADESPGCTDGFKWLDSTDPNPNIAEGALVGGPFQNETYIDSRNNSMQTEPSTYNSAVIVGLLSSLVTTSSAVKSFT
ncbi:glycoside hydrolase family 9 B5 [Tripterygium wilfordii]|uniref:Endoglucanase n=1 Tax=Tripterygium wilfordii TaxID=458696 RepID=A0A7J7DLM7_TRIWF|nr:glycoside hydrolase family 9 B5 [Tripterygium wilfordii]